MDRQLHRDLHLSAYYEVSDYLLGGFAGCCGHDGGASVYLCGHLGAREWSDQAGDRKDGNHLCRHRNCRFGVCARRRSSA